MLKKTKNKKRKSVKDYGDKISAGDKSNVDKELNNLKEAIKASDDKKIKQGMESLQKVSHKLAEEVYKATAAQQSSGQSSAAGGQSQSNAGSQHSNHPGGGHTATDTEKEDIIDADFKAEDDKK
jgi:molecular chaperone DnaK